MTFTKKFLSVVSQQVLHVYSFLYYDIRLTWRFSFNFVTRFILSVMYLIRCIFQEKKLITNCFRMILYWKVTGLIWSEQFYLFVIGNWRVTIELNFIILIITFKSNFCTVICEIELSRVKISAYLRTHSHHAFFSHLPLKNIFSQ